MGENHAVHSTTHFCTYPKLRGDAQGGVVRPRRVGAVRYFKSVDTLLGWRNGSGEQAVAPHWTRRDLRDPEASSK